MNVDAAAERIIQKIKSYMDADENKTLTKEEEEEALVSIIKIMIEEVVTLATVAALIQTKKAVDGAMKDHLKKLAIDANELYERMKKDGHI